MTGGLEDTIAAIATAPGRAGVAVIRVSGPDAWRIASAVGVPEAAARVATVARIQGSRGETLDRAVVTRFAGPASYTGEDVVEISTHGGAMVPALVLDAVCAAGARPAEPGEFTRRAYLNGKLDLVQVEATGELIDASSQAHHRAAVFQLEGGLSRRVEVLGERVMSLQALLGYDIDFPEEDDGPVPPERIACEARDLLSELADLLRYAPEGELLHDGALTVLAGAPNSGKSSIFNMLLGIERAIVTEVPGTTRDAVEATASLEGYPFRLVDTAGVRDRAEPIERLGIEVARRYLDAADLVLLCIEAGRLPGREERALAARAAAQGAKVLILRTKTDLGEPSGGADWEEVTAELPVSARSGAGIPQLRAALVDAVFSGLRRASVPALVTGRRQTRALEAAREELAKFLDVFEAGIPAEVASTHIREAACALESVIGVTDLDEVLERIFSSFCVGK